MPSKRHAGVAATLIALTSMVAGGQHGIPDDTDREAFVQILSAPATPEDDTGWTNANNGGCNPDDPAFIPVTIVEDL